MSLSLLITPDLQVVYSPKPYSSYEALSKDLGPLRRLGAHLRMLVVPHLNP